MLPLTLNDTPSLVPEVGSVFGALARWEQFLVVSGRANEETRRQYRNVVFGYMAKIISDPDWPGSRDPLKANEDDVVSYLAQVSPRGGYRNQTMKGLVSFYRWAYQRRLIAENPCAALHPRDRRYGEAESLGQPEMKRLLAAAEEVDPRARWAIQLQYATACRAGSLVAVMPEDLSWTPPYVRFREAKNDDPYGVQLNTAGTSAARNLIDLLDYTPPKVGTRLPTLLGVRYAGYRRWLKTAAEEAGVPAWTHLIRHTAITRLAEDPTVDVRTIMGIANWKDPRLLDRYAKKSEGRQRHAIAALDRSLEEG